MYKYIFSNLDPTVFDSEVQICRYEGLGQVQMDQGIDQTEWGQWDIQTLAENEAIVSPVIVNVSCFWYWFWNLLCLFCWV